MRPPLTFEALGTTWWIEIFADISGETRHVMLHDLAIFAAHFEATYSRFRSDSTLSQLNIKRTLPSPALDVTELLQYGVDLYDRTNHHFNLLIGERLLARGYDADYSFVIDESKLEVIVPDPRTALTITDTVITLQAGLLDIGGYGKGYLIDLIAERLRSVHGQTEFLINGGGDMYGTTEHGAPIMIHLEHPTKPSYSLGTTTLLNQGFAASSPHKRSWKRDGTNYTHIVSTVDTPTTDIDASFILADSARDADAFATVALLMPPAEFATVATREKLAVATYQAEHERFTRSGSFPFQPSGA
jgi:FAD:protein FMN transferase